MLNVWDYQIDNIEKVQLNISDMQHDINVSHYGDGNYNALNMQRNTNVRTVIISLNYLKNPPFLFFLL